VCRRRLRIKFDMVDLAAFARDLVGGESISDRSGIIGQFIEIRKIDRQWVFLYKKKPVAAPGNVSVNDADAGPIDRDIFCKSVARHVRDRSAFVGVQIPFNVAYRSFYSVSA